MHLPPSAEGQGDLSPCTPLVRCRLQPYPLHSVQIGDIFNPFSFKSTVADVLKRCKDKGIAYNTISSKSATEIESLLFGSAGRKPRICEPDWKTIHDKMTNDPGIKLKDLFRSYLEDNQDGYKYSYFHERYHQWLMRTHPDEVCSNPTVKEKPTSNKRCWLGWFRKTVTCLDLSGQETYDECTDKFITHDNDEDLQKVYIFFAIIGDSRMPFIEAFAQADQIRMQWGIKDALSYYNGLPDALVTNSGQTAEKYNTMYSVQSNHGYCNLVRSLNVSAESESFAENDIICNELKILNSSVRAFLTGHTYKSVDQVNEHLRLLMSNLANERIGRFSRKTIYEKKDLPNLRPLSEETIPSFDTRYVTRVPNNYHIKVDNTYYSVPYTYYRCPVLVYRYMDKISIWDIDGSLIHDYERRSRGYITTPEDMPTPEQRKAFTKNYFTGDYYRTKAKTIGDDCFYLVDSLLCKAKYEEQMYKYCNAIIYAAKTEYDKDIINNACGKVLVKSKRPTYAAFKAAMSETRIHSKEAV